MYFTYLKPRNILYVWKFIPVLGVFKYFSFIIFFNTAHQQRKDCHICQQRHCIHVPNPQVIRCDATIHSSETKTNRKKESKRKLLRIQFRKKNVQDKQNMELAEKQKRMRRILFYFLVGGQWSGPNDQHLEQLVRFYSEGEKGEQKCWGGRSPLKP